MSDHKHQIPSEEWDFLTCPKDELEECWWYEFKRESPHARQIITDWRQGCIEQTFDEFLRRARTMLMPPAPGRLYALCPEWPKYPYLSIPSAERSRRLKQLKQFSPDDKIKLLVDQLTWPSEPSIYDLMQELEGKRPKCPIPYHKSNQEVVSFVKDWLARYRPDNTKINTSIRSLQADLKALGTLRILRVSDWNWGPPLYKWQGEWIKARARAEKIIEDLSS